MITQLSKEDIEFDPHKDIFEQLEDLQDVEYLIRPTRYTLATPKSHILWEIRQKEAYE